MAYNKSKYVEAAQKLLNQGKVAQAIAEYQQILKYEPRDQVTLMTIGELYIRQGETFQAIEYFERLAQLFVSDGFLTKAIAVYKRISKLAPEEVRPLEKLADLYVQQGVMSEARPLFLQLAELHLKTGKQPEAIALLKKLLLAEPDNLRIQVRLADLYVAMGQSGEALESYVSAAQRALARGDQAECERLADRALQINAKNLDALIVKARSYSSAGNTTKATEILERVPDLDKGGEPAELLLDLYLKSSKWEEATALALRIFSNDEKNFTATQKVTEGLLESGQGERATSILSRIRIPMIDAGEHEGVVNLLQNLATRLPGRLEPLEWLADTFGRTSDSFRLPDALANLGDALLASGKTDRAKEIFEQLVDRDPENDSAKRKLNEALRKMGVKPADSKAAPEPAVVEESLQAELPQPPVAKIRGGLHDDTPIVDAQAAGSGKPGPGEQELDEETQKFIAQSLTDVDLFASYGLTQKAIGLLEAILRRTPNHTPTLEKLLDFVLGAGDDRRTAELAARLEEIHKERGDAAGGERFGELRRRFQRAAGLSDEEIAAAANPSAPAVSVALPFAAKKTAQEEVPVFITEAAPAQVSSGVPPPPKPSEAKPVHEVDLSDEWASLLEQGAAIEAVPPVKPQTPPAEKNSVKEVAPANREPASAAPQETEISEFEIPIESPAAQDPAPGTTTNAGSSEALRNASVEMSAEAPAPESSADAGEETIEIIPIEESGKEELPPPPAPAAEIELDQEYELVLTPEPETEQPQDSEPVATAGPVKPAALSGSQVLASDQFLADLASEIDQLGIGELTPSFSDTADKENAPIAATTAEAPASPAEPDHLKEVFDDFRAEIGEMGAEDEDLETHYNLGIAFREMGLLEEAISEFQKVAKANEKGKAFRYAMQCCTLLGLAFMEKGQPSIAAIWYERALHTPGVDAESTLALRYDLGVAQESANDLDAALKSFSQVYAVNIDYRGVADRIAALQKTTR